MKTILSLYFPIFFEHNFFGFVKTLWDDYRLWLLLGRYNNDTRLIMLNDNPTYLFLFLCNV